MFVSVDLREQPGTSVIHRLMWNNEVIGQNVFFKANRTVTGKAICPQLDTTKIRPMLMRRKNVDADEVRNKNPERTSLYPSCPLLWHR